MHAAAHRMSQHKQTNARRLPPWPLHISATVFLFHGAACFGLFKSVSPRVYVPASACVTGASPLPYPGLLPYRYSLTSVRPTPLPPGNGLGAAPYAARNDLADVCGDPHQDVGSLGLAANGNLPIQGEHEDDMGRWVMPNLSGR